MILWFFIFLVILSAFFSGSETSLFSIDKVTRNRLFQSTQRVDRVISSMLAHPRKLLITILLGNEVTNVALSVVGASLTQALLPNLSTPQQALVSAITVVPILLIFGEITPKTISANQSELVAKVVAYPLRIFALGVQPLVSVLRLFSESLLPLVGTKPAHEEAGGDSEIGESEFRTIVDASMREGIVEAQERRLIHNVLDFGELTVGEVMHPWSDVVSIKETTSIDDAIDLVVNHQFSRLPTWRTDPRRITGIVLAKDLLMVKWKHRTVKNLNTLRRTPLFTLPTTPAAALLSDLKDRRFHMAVVVDSGGRAIGICTMEDLLEELFGPISDASTTALKARESEHD